MRPRILRPLLRPVQILEPLLSAGPTGERCFSRLLCKPETEPHLSVTGVGPVSVMPVSGSDHNGPR